MTTNNRVIRYDAHARRCTCGKHDATKPKAPNPAIRERRVLSVNANDEREALKKLKERDGARWTETNTDD